MSGELVEYKRFERLASLVSIARLPGSCKSVALLAVASAVVPVAMTTVEGSVRWVGWGCTICTVVPCQLNCCLPQ